MRTSRDPQDIAAARAQLARAGRRRQPTKYRAVATIVDGIWFQSAHEAHRYRELRLLERAGEIRDLQLQPVFPIALDGVVVSEYVADFRYVDRHGEVVIEDAKGFRTPVFILKKKLVEAMYPFEIREV